MYEHQKINAMTAGDDIRSVYLINQASLQQSRNGPYWRLEFKDASGTVEANGTHEVKMKQTIPEGIGTSDMAAWLVWVEVDANLDFQWKMDANAKGTGLNLHTH